MYALTAKHTSSRPPASSISRIRILHTPRPKSSRSEVYSNTSQTAGRRSSFESQFSCVGSRVSEDSIFNIQYSVVDWWCDGHERLGGLGGVLRQHNWARMSNLSLNVWTLYAEPRSYDGMYRQQQASSCCKRVVRISGASRPGPLWARCLSPSHFFHSRAGLF